MVAVRIFEVVAVGCEDRQRFQLYSDLDSTALSQLYSFPFFGFWFPNRGRGIFEVAAGELRSSSTPQLSSRIQAVVGVWTRRTSTSVPFVD